jgi:hypothetical protein
MKQKRKSRAASAPKKAAKRAAKPDEAASGRFIQDLLVRKEAAKPGKDEKLPPEATHVITKENADGTAEVKRVRFKLF